MKQTRPYQVGISGSYGGLNLGDEAILESIVEQLRETLPVEITVFSRNPQDTLQRHKIDHAVAVRKLSRDEITPEIKKLDLFILGGGGILYDAQAKIYLREAEIAAELSVPFMLYAVGAGPLADTAIHPMLSDIVDLAAAVKTLFEDYVRQHPDQWKDVHGLWDLIDKATKKWRPGPAPRGHAFLSDAPRGRDCR